MEGDTSSAGFAGEPSVLPYPVSDRKDAEHVHHAVAIHLDHSLEEPQIPPGAVRRQRLALGKPALVFHCRHAREPSVAFGNEAAETVAISAPS